MKIGSLKEEKDSRVAFTPESVKKCVLLGINICLEKGYGEHMYNASEYQDAGATFESQKTIINSDILAQVFLPKSDIIKQLSKNQVVVSLMNPFHDKKSLERVAKQGVRALAMEFVPRSTRAQKMDVLSSQASLAGYVAVMMASERLKQVLPMMMTPAGTLSPAKVFIVGAGVAGLQAIATAKRLGARVEAFDTRPAVEEQVKSLGGKFLKIDLGDTGETKDGYAKQLTEEQLSKQRDMMKKACETSDVVITTAQVFGRKAPLIITKDMVSSMKKGTIVVDLAVETGGNVEGVELNKEKDINGVTLIGHPQLAQRVAKHASEMYAANIYHLISEFYDEESKVFNMNLDDEIMASVLTTQDGKIVQKMLLESFSKNKEKGA
ncbi:NAD(P)(+) transhydrogenase (Re/Si-specific) subunit alpha [Candidatus Marinamargulisbacteria bacterium SCGC AG-343-D04]|nr:NAD(P)(+) transhydrogenase (Re/Si-specific) subunit alpha [Candidatus Marinamargulisbacteria bacterium SCGC AG-343-D04]